MGRARDRGLILVVLGFFGLMLAIGGLAYLTHAERGEPPRGSLHRLLNGGDR